MSLDGPSPCVNCGHDYSEHSPLTGKCLDETYQRTVTREMALDAGDPSLEGTFHSWDNCPCPGFEPKEGPLPESELLK